MKFYPQDWRADEKLRLCSLSARGLWIEMLALMHRSERYGQLLISGHVPTDAQLAVQVGAPSQEVSAMLSELESAGVFSRAASGAIYSRRMTRDEKKARIARKNGKNGGNPKLRKQTENPSSDKGLDKGGVKPQRPEARGQRSEDSPNQRVNENAADAPDGASGYAFDGVVIKLSEVDLARWRRTYHSIADMTAELASLDCWFQGDGAAKAEKWFFTAQGALNRKHQANMAARSEASANADRITV